MRIIDRYIITEFLKVFIVCVVGFTLVFLLGEIPDKIKLYFRYDPSPWMMARYFLVKTPGYLFFVQPLAILMGGMLSLSMLARNSEIIAMQANGIDALSIARPVLLIGAIGSALMFVSNETLIPWSNRTSEAIQRRIQGQDEQATVIKRNQIWIRGPHSMTHIERYDERHAVLERVSIVKWTDAYKFTERVYADKAKWWGDHWLLYGVNLTRRADNGRFVVQALPTMHAAIDKPPSEFGRVELVAKEMNLFQLGRYIEKLREEGQSADKYLVDWYDKTAFPFVCLIMAALSVPFAIRINPRFGGMALGLGVSIVAAFSYWIVHTAFIALGHGGYLPPMLAAYGANIVFGLGAGILLLQAGT